MDYTIVTAFYIMKSKCSPDKYKQWINNFLRLNMKCVFFTNKQTKEWFDSWTVLPDNIRVEILEFEEFVTAKYNWDKQREMDFEMHYSKELYMVWNEKINFLYKACSENHFRTKWFIWCDMGSVRNEVLLKFNNNFIKSNILCVLDYTKSYFFRIFNEKFNTGDDKFFIENKHKYVGTPCDLNVIQGGFILTNLNMYKTLHTEFYELLDKLYNDNLFIGKDQLTYLSLVTKSSNVKVIEILTNMIVNYFHDVWFFVYTFLLDISIYRYINYSK
jgi:hypothetical protein